MPIKRITRPVGNTVEKKISSKTRGAIIEPKKSPNLIQILLGITNACGAKQARTINIADTNNDQKRMSFDVIRGYKAIIKNTIENMTPKDFGDECSILM